MAQLIVFSHLRWNFVYQRPQHLLSRLARNCPVVFVEEPVFDAGPPHLERTAPCAGVEVLRPHTPIRAGGFHDDQLSFLKTLLDDYLTQQQLRNYVVWFYTPMALPLLNGLRPQAVVYDCMDELAAFKDAPKQMRQRETALLKLADVVLTGGPRLFEAKRHLSRHVLCVPSAVDAHHYDGARAVADAGLMQRAAALQGDIPAPRLGFFGVVDERIDLDLLARVADAQPGWHLVMVGPVVKIDPSSLPQRPNLHWLGQQPYELLPQLVAGWDVCLLPFALNESTAFISPTKTLEYMAAGKAIVSTAIHDVKAMFGDIVAITAGVEAFVGACRSALDESRSHAREREMRMRVRVALHSWDQAATTAHTAIESALTASLSEERLDAAQVADREVEVFATPAKSATGG